MTTITINTLENSPELCYVNIHSSNGEYDSFAFNLAEAIQLRNELTNAINEHQKHFSEEHISNAGNKSGRI